MARWNNCNILQIAPDAKKLWQFDAKGGGFVLGREQKVPHTQTLSSKYIAKNWSSLWQPKLNVAWLPPEKVFLRVAELPASNEEETVSMVELQLEKLSPLPVTQIVWTVHVLGTRTAEAKGDLPPESLQTVVVVIVERATVELFLGKLEQEGFLADRLEVPMLDQLVAISPTEDGAWMLPQIIGGQNVALVAWWVGGALRNLSFVNLPPVGDRTKELKHQLTLLFMAGEVEGWLTGPMPWHLVADPVNATEWEGLLRTGAGGAGEGDAAADAGGTGGPDGQTLRRGGGKTNLLPPEFSTRYREQFFDRLWLRGLGYAGLLYVICLVIYFCGVAPTRATGRKTWRRKRRPSATTIPTRSN